MKKILSLLIVSLITQFGYSVEEIGTKNSATREDVRFGDAIANSITSPSKGMKGAEAAEPQSVTQAQSGIKMELSPANQESANPANPLQNFSKEDLASKAKESEIPLKLNEQKEKTEANHLPVKIFLSLGVILSLGGLFVLLNRKAQQRKLLNPHTQIRVLTQHVLGPKKSLAVVTIAGESILIGITDHHISHIKSLSLLDEELPVGTPVSFEEELKTDMNKNSSPALIEKKLQATAKGEEYSMQGLREIVSKKVQSLRSLS